MVNESGEGERPRTRLWRENSRKLFKFFNIYFTNIVSPVNYSEDSKILKALFASFCRKQDFFEQEAADETSSAPLAESAQNDALDPKVRIMMLMK